MQHIVPVIDTAIKDAGLKTGMLDAIAFTQSPGLIGSLLVGGQFAKSLAMALGTMRHRGVDAPPPNTVEGILHALPESRYVIGAAQLKAMARHICTVPRVSPYFGYAPLDPSHLPRVDGVVYVRDVPHG